MDSIHGWLRMVLFGTCVVVGAGCVVYLAHMITVCP